jgi:hypothetical protein
MITLSVSETTDSPTDRNSSRNTPQKVPELTVALALKYMLKHKLLINFMRLDLVPKLSYMVVQQLRGVLFQPPSKRERF